MSHAIVTLSPDSEDPENIISAYNYEIRSHQNLNIFKLDSIACESAERILLPDLVRSRLFGGQVTFNFGYPTLTAKIRFTCDCQLTGRTFAVGVGTRN